MTACSSAFSFCSSTFLYDREHGSDWNEPRAKLCYAAKQHFRKDCIDSKQSRPARIEPARCWSLQRLMFGVLLAVVLCSQTVYAQASSSLQQDVALDELLFDRTAPPIPPMRFSIDGPVLQQRDDAEGKDAIDVGRDESSQKQLDFSLPRPFDTNLGNNFTSTSCPAFFQSFLDDTSFRKCLPLSLLLQTSSAFFTITRSFEKLTDTLDATCDVDYRNCSSLMSQLAQRLQLSDHCGADLQMENPMVVQAYNGFMAYDPLYDAGCLKETDGSFCYANAISNVTLAGSSFVYYLPLGVELPGSTQLSCTPCLRNTMSAFSSFASDSKQALSGDYAMAASQIDMSCGPRFAKASVQMNAANRLPGYQSNLGVAALLVVVFFRFV